MRKLIFSITLKQFPSSFCQNHKYNRYNNKSFHLKHVYSFVISPNNQLPGGGRNSHSNTGGAGTEFTFRRTQFTDSGRNLLKPFTIITLSYRLNHIMPNGKRNLFLSIIFPHLAKIPSTQVLQNLKKILHNDITGFTAQFLSCLSHLRSLCVVCSLGIMRFTLIRQI